VRFAGITGHRDPAILVEAMRRYAFDTVLLPVNPADPAFLPFLTTVVPEARRRGMGIIGMKVLGAGRLVGDFGIRAADLIRYALSHDVDTAIVGCASPDEVRADLAIGRGFTPMSESDRQALESRIAPVARRVASYKRG
jgi:predicted aldo/keto reductase-like oxidoreductase